MSDTTGSFFDFPSGGLEKSDSGFSSAKEATVNYTSATDVRESRLFTVDPKYNGPDGYANGGYVCGRLAAELGDGATVRLKRPVGVGLQFEMIRSAESIDLVRDGKVHASALPLDFEMDVLVPSMDDTMIACANVEPEHSFPRCFVCGPERGPYQGLRILPRRLQGHSGVVACTWRPHYGLGASSGAIAPEFVWAALDCPGAWAYLHDEPGPMLLGTLAVRLLKPAACGVTYVVAGWQLGADGRKRHSGTVLCDAEGTVYAFGRATWIVVGSRN